MFFVSVAFKGVTNAVSLLFATLARWLISVADKELRGWSWGRQDRKGADRRGLADERRALGLKQELHKTARSERARILNDDHTVG